MHSHTTFQLIKWFTALILLMLLVRYANRNNVDREDNYRNSQNENDWEVKTRDRFIHRNQILHENCKKHHALVINKREEVPYLHYVRNIMYCPISKTGTTTWKGYMFKLIGKIKNLEMNNDGTWFHKMTKTKIQARTAFSPLELYRIMSGASASPIIRVLGVRPPLERLVSAYKGFFEGYQIAINLSENAIDTSKNKKKYLKYVSYEKFIEKDVLAENPEHKQLDRHWMEYDRVCAPCSFHYDYIVHLDTFQEDVKYIYKVAGIKDDMDFTVKYHQSVNSEDSPYEEYNRNLSKDMLRGLYLKYRQDFFLFGYKIPDILKEFHNE